MNDLARFQQRRKRSGANGHTRGKIYQDPMVRLFVDAPDDDDARRFFAQYKEVLKERYRQLDIWMTTYPLEVL